MRTTIANLRRAQEANLRLLAATQPGGAAGAAVRAGLAETSRRVLAVTPVDTGSWRASHRVQQRGMSGSIDIDPTARNARSGALVWRYVERLKRRGGRYDVYGSVARNDQAAIIEAMRRAFEDAI